MLTYFIRTSSAALQYSLVLRLRLDYILEAFGKSNFQLVVTSQKGSSIPDRANTILPPSN